MIEYNDKGLKFTLEAHYDSYGNLYFTALDDKGFRVNSDEPQTRDACINSLKNGVNYYVI